MSSATSLTVVKSTACCGSCPGSDATSSRKSCNPSNTGRMACQVVKAPGTINRVRPLASPSWCKVLLATVDRMPLELLVGGKRQHQGVGTCATGNRSAALRTILRGIGSSMINFGGFHHVWDELAPGQVLPLPVSFGPGAHLTGVGVYGVEAVMPALNLWSARSTIAVLP